MLISVYLLHNQHYPIIKTDFEFRTKAVSICQVPRIGVVIYGLPINLSPLTALLYNLD